MLGEGIGKGIREGLGGRLGDVLGKRIEEGLGERFDEGLEVEGRSVVRVLESPLKGAREGPEREQDTCMKGA